MRIALGERVHYSTLYRVAGVVARAQNHKTTRRSTLVEIVSMRSCRVLLCVDDTPPPTKPFGAVDKWRLVK